MTQNNPSDTMTNLQDRRAFFAVKNEAYASPKGTYKTMTSDPDSIVVVDVRNPVGPIPTRIPGSIWIPQNEIEARMGELPRDKPIVLCCWEAWCGLAASAAVPLLDAGYDVKEMHGGISGWRFLRQPLDTLTETVS
jgi:rhodanese-related sulfurtransferase